MTTPAAPTGSGGVGPEQLDATGCHRARPSHRLGRAVTCCETTQGAERVSSILQRMVVPQLIQDNPGLAPHLRSPDGTPSTTGSNPAPAPSQFTVEVDLIGPVAHIAVTVSGRPQRAFRIAVKALRSHDLGRMLLDAAGMLDPTRPQAPSGPETEAAE